MNSYYIRIAHLTAALLLSSTFPLQADEGMWLFNDLPKKLLLEKYDFTPTDSWTEHLRLASVRFNTGGSASFVSSNGLVLTNHHVGASTLHKLSDAEHNYATDGFLAHSTSEELKAPDLELNQLVSIEDVTAQVNAVVIDDMDPDDAATARRAVMADLEKKSLDQTGLRSDVITLYGGAKYHLYRFKKYTDVRLVWAPEASSAFFGGDADNFEYPRYCLDVTLFRVYENGKPAKIDHFLRWSENGAGADELVFVSGNPGRTERIFTTAALRYLRDKKLPRRLNYLRRKEIMLQQYSLAGPEQQRRASRTRFGIENNRKRSLGMLQGLQTPKFIATKQQQEDALLAALRGRADLKDAESAWQQIAQVQQERAAFIGVWTVMDGQYYHFANHLLLMASEDQKPSGERLREYRDSARESLLQKLFSPAPIYEDLEIAKLADSLSLFAEDRGGDDPLVKKVLAGQSPQQRAMALIQGSQLASVEVRQKIAGDDAASLANSPDTMIQLAQLLEPEYRRIRRIRDKHKEIERQAYAQINAAQVALHGTDSYPDATFSLRLAFGTVRGYQEAGQTVAPWTTMGGAFAHQAAHQAHGDWRLPESWTSHESQIDKRTPLNFVCTADIIGGNSGSPVVNRAGEFVGIIFDGNIQSLTSAYFYTDEVCRAVSVHSSAIREALRKIYKAGHLADQLGK
ncbi:MAG: S46 family peptidase [Planctomycetes bacterium]|nr:S46 family peptidase [Planctomycetota bacterium]